MPERTEHAPGTPSWVELTTTDIDAAKDFYAATLGWDYQDMPVPDSPPYTMASRKGKSVAGLFPQPAQMAEQGMPSMWNTYVTVADVEQTVASAEAAGGAVHQPVMEVMEAGRMAVVGDPTGAACCLWEPNQHIGAELVNEHGALTWTDLMTGDRQAASDFYTGLFGWEPVEVEGPQGAGMMFNLAGAPIASASAAPEGVPPHWAVYFSVDDCDACAQAITDNGGTIMAGPMDIPPGRMVAATDPTGAAFNAIELNPDFDPTAA